MNGITIYTPGNLDVYDSYGLLACELGRHIARTGMHVNLIPLGERIVEGQPEEVRRIAEQPIQMGYGGLLLGYPTSYAKFSPTSLMGRTVAVTMFESTQIPDEWLPILNSLDAIIVPSNFCKLVFEDCGVTTPIHFVPLGIDPHYKPVYRDPYKRPLTFLTFMDRGRRKGAYHAMQAFLRAFGEDPDYKLIVKSRRPDTHTVELLNPNMEIVQEDMTVAELYRLYQSAHVLINPNLGEGFGLIPREFAASGGLALATYWGGTAEAIESWGVPIPVADLVPAWGGHSKHEGLGYWAEPDVEALACLLKLIAKTPEYYMDRAMTNAQSAISQYQWSECAEEVLKVWNGHSISDPALAG